jgi:nucleoid-associated protein YgaU
MPSFTLIANRSVHSSSRGPTQFAIVSRDGSMRYAAPYAPLEIDFGGYGWTYSQSERPGRTPVSSPATKALRTMAMELMIVNRTSVLLGSGASLDDALPIEDQLTALSTLADSLQPLTVEYGTQCQGLWVITSLTFKSIARSPVNNQITRATAHIEFQEYSPYSFYIAPPPPPAPPHSGGGGGGRPSSDRTTKKYKVKKGDTLSVIARKTYGSSSKKNIQKIIKANKPAVIKKIKAGKAVGKVVNIPRPKPPAKKKK